VKQSVHRSPLGPEPQRNHDALQILPSGANHD
jgi:hypothetical protein